MMRTATVLCTGVTAAAGGAATLASAPGLTDAPGRHAANNRFATSAIAECVRARDPRVPALALDGTRLGFDIAAGQEPGTRPRCRRDELRLLRLQTLSIAGARTYVRRGGCRLPCVVPQATVHVPASAFAQPVALLPVTARNRNGAPVAGCDRHVRNAPQRVGGLLRRMYYKTPDELRRRRNAGRSGGDGARWSNYGDPGARYGSPGRGARHYNYLLWNLPRTRAGTLPGGGIVAAILRAGQRLALCRGERLTLPAFDRGGARVGAVSFGYASVRSRARGRHALYGWVLLGYRYEERPFVATTTPSA